MNQFDKNWFDKYADEVPEILSGENSPSMASEKENLQIPNEIALRSGSREMTG